MNALAQAQQRRRLQRMMATSHLPVLPPNSPYLLKAMSRDDMSFRELAKVVEQFPTIAARLLALANSSWSAPTRPIDSLEMACGRLGFFVVRSVSIALTVASVFNPRACPAFDSLRYWTSALLGADLGSRLARATPAIEEEAVATARTAGLLHNLGLLWLASWLPEPTHQALSEGADPNRHASLDELLARHCGMGYCEASARLGEAWSFPPILTRALHHQRSLDYRGRHWPMAALLAGTGHLLHWLEEDATAPPPVTDPRLIELGLTEEEHQRVAEAALDQRQRLQTLAKHLFSV